MPEAAENRLVDLMARYPNSKSAVMPALYMAQEVHGWLTEDAYSWVSERLNLPKVHVKQVATFYTMYYKKPVGRYHVQVCRTLSCMLCGSRGVVGHLKKRTGLSSGEITKDGMWSYEEVECLGSCGTAPMVQINDVFFENLTTEKLDEIMDRIEKEQPDLRYSTIREELGGGLADMPRSQVWQKDEPVTQDDVNG
jgi:NADH-quinone oxidoreductase subunit E